MEKLKNKVYTSAAAIKADQSKAELAVLGMTSLRSNAAIK